MIWLYIYLTGSLLVLISLVIVLYLDYRDGETNTFHLNDYFIIIVALLLSWVAFVRICYVFRKDILFTIKGKKNEEE